MMYFEEGSVHARLDDTDRALRRLDEARAARTSIENFPTLYARPILEQAAIAGAFLPGAVDADLQGVAERVAGRLETIPLEEAEQVPSLLDEVAGLGDRLKALDAELESVQGELEAIALGIPNVPHASVPDGTGENDNREERRWGEPPAFDFEPMDHVDLGARPAGAQGIGQQFDPGSGNSG